MAQARVRPDRVTYNSALAATRKELGAWRTALWLLAELGDEADAIALEAACAACVTCGRTWPLPALQRRLAELSHSRLRKGEIEGASARTPGLCERMVPQLRVLLDKELGPGAGARLQRVEAMLERMGRGEVFQDENEDGKRYAPGFIEGLEPRSPFHVTKAYPWAQALRKHWTEIQAELQANLETDAGSPVQISGALLKAAGPIDSSKQGTTGGVVSDVVTGRGNAGRMAGLASPEPEGDGPLWNIIKQQLYKPEVKLIKRLVGHQLIQQNKLMWDEIFSLRQMLAEFRDQKNDQLCEGRRQHADLCDTQHRELLKRQAQILLEDLRSQTGTCGYGLEDMVPELKDCKVRGYLQEERRQMPASTNALHSAVHRIHLELLLGDLQSLASLPSMGQPLGLDDMDEVAANIREALETERQWLLASIAEEYERLAGEEQRRASALSARGEPSTAELQKFLHRLQEISKSPSLRTLSLAPQPALGGANVRRLQALISRRRQNASLKSVEEAKNIAPKVPEVAMFSGYTVGPDNREFDPFFGVRLTLLQSAASSFMRLSVQPFEIFFAQMPPKTKILEHSDNQNYILTLHLGLLLEQGKCSLQVGQRKRDWEEGQAFVFDTTFIHSATNDSSRSRYVLVLRFWHPNLSKEERRAVQISHLLLAGTPDPEKAKREADRRSRRGEALGHDLITAAFRGERSVRCAAEYLENGVTVKTPGGALGPPLSSSGGKEKRKRAEVGLAGASQAALPVKIGQASDEAVALFSSKSSEELLPRKTTDLGDDELSIETAFVTSWIFEMGCGVVIMISVLTVAWEVDGMQAPVFLQFMESLVTSFFLMEWLVRLKVMGWRWLLDPTVIFDTFIV
ncbi:unnamed protein product [Effrenium voratum]|nr:unnamed protein product [Effrenium voratum]